MSVIGTWVVGRYGMFDADADCCTDGPYAVFSMSGMHIQLKFEADIIPTLSIVRTEDGKHTFERRNEGTCLVLSGHGDSPSYDSSIGKKWIDKSKGPNRRKKKRMPCWESFVEIIRSLLGDGTFTLDSILYISPRLRDALQMPAPFMSDSE